MSGRGASKARRDDRNPRELGHEPLPRSEDHFEEGGIGEAVTSSLANEPVKVYNLAVSKMPKSGKPAQLLEYEEISANAIIKKVKKILHDASS